MVATAVLEVVTPGQATMITTGALEGAKEVTEAGTSVVAVALGPRTQLALKRGARIKLIFPQ